MQLKLGQKTNALKHSKTHLALSMFGAEGMALLRLAAGSFPALVASAGRSLTFTVVSAVQGTHGYFFVSGRDGEGLGKGERRRNRHILRNLVLSSRWVV